MANNFFLPYWPFRGLMKVAMGGNNRKCYIPGKLAISQLILEGKLLNLHFCAFFYLVTKEKIKFLKDSLQVVFTCDWCELSRESISDNLNRRTV